LKELEAGKNLIEPLEIFKKNEKKLSRELKSVVDDLDN
jgi:hypothetical protein